MPSTFSPGSPGRAAAPAGRPPPTGHARKTAGHYAAAGAAARFQAGAAGQPPAPDGAVSQPPGPDGAVSQPPAPDGAFTHPKQLLEPLRRAGQALPFPRAALDTLALLFDFSNPGDWRPGRVPMVYPSNAELAGCLGVSDRTVRNHLSALEAAGAITIHRGPGNRRTPVRDHAGRIVDAYGINLAPMVELARALGETAAALKTRRAALKREMRNLGQALQEVRTAADALEVAAAEHPAAVAPAGRLAATGRAAEAMAAAARRAYARDPGLTAADQPANAAAIAAAAATLRAEAKTANGLAERVLAELLEKEDSGSAESGCRQSLQTNSNDPSDRYNTPCKTQVAAASEDLNPRSVSRTTTAADRWRLPRAEIDRRTPAFQAATPASRPIRLRPAEMVALAPALAEILADCLLVADPARAGAAEMVTATKILAGRLGVSAWCWAQGCRAHGEAAAALAVVVAAVKPAHEIRKSRAAFLAGMLLRPPGELNALASFHALRKSRAGAGGGPGGGPGG